jgi:hypothetical protein
MQVLIKLVGFALTIVGVYFLGRNIFFTTEVYPYWWRGISADVSVPFLLAGILGLIFLPRRSRNLGWIAIGAAIALIIASGGVVLKPISLWHFILSFAAFAGRFRLMTTGRIDDF